MTRVGTRSTIRDRDWRRIGNGVREKSNGSGLEGWPSFDRCLLVQTRQQRCRSNEQRDIECALGLPEVEDEDEAQKLQIDPFTLREFRCVTTPDESRDENSPPPVVFGAAARLVVRRAGLE
ncbi:hypothetical protein AXG93_1112s1210 [Marchantia polymorpha subsp. ruderalis]|uniref:Uncharacterized protein n=1 Tax=Marchantia polymorpha subsp. ruderalis TaxID=1480154 RepID=A0A176WAV5_MARPO|nr:hypothetical protein AXG93_1112s1210 [Marchantia polymorpha subsp. ruderalis]